jgi:predicted DNA-binding transcriptional regulator YafY
MPRGDQLSRQWSVIQQLIASGGGISAAELARGVGCTRRTIYRDLEALQTAGFPIYTERDNGRHVWKLIEGVRRNIPIPFTLTELMSLYFCRDMLRPLRETVFAESLETLFHKIKTTLPPESMRYLDTVQQTFSVGTKHSARYGRFKEVINRVNEAALQRKAVDIRYRALSSRTDTRRTVDPYRIWFYEGAFYLVGFCHLRRKIRTFSCARIQTVTMTDHSYRIPDEFDFEAMMRGSFGAYKGVPERVVIHFDAAIAEYIGERIWHASQKIIRQSDHSIVFEADVAVNDELKLWILSWGARATVLHPLHLRETIAAEITVMAESYNTKNTRGSTEPHT